MSWERPQTDLWADLLGNKRDIDLILGHNALKGKHQITLLGPKLDQFITNIEWLPKRTVFAKP